MASQNPFAPFGRTKPMAAPKLRPMPTPNSNFQQRPSTMQTLAPTAFNLAMGSDEAGAAKDYLMGQGKDIWSTMSGTAPAMGSTASLSAPSVMAGAEGAIAQQALANPALSKAATTALMGAAPATVGSGMAATAGPLAALGPMAVPVIMGAALMSGK